MGRGADQPRTRNVLVEASRPRRRPAVVRASGLLAPESVARQRRRARAHQGRAGHQRNDAAGNQNQHGQSRRRCARDIARRILPAAQAAAAELAQKVDEANRAESGQADTARRLAEILGAEVRGLDRNDPSIYSGLHGVTFKPSYGGGSVTIESYGIPAALAFKIAALVAKEAAEEAAET